MSYESPRDSKRVKSEGVRLRLEVEINYKELLKFATQHEVDLLSEENKIIKVLAQCKSSPNSPLTSVEELYSLGNKCTLPQAVLHSISDMNLEICFRTLTVITIKGVSALVSSQLGFSTTAEIDYLELN